MLPQIRQDTQSSASRMEPKSKLLKHVAASPGTWPDIIQKCRIFQGAVLPCIPLLRIKAQEDGNASKKGSPHQNVPNRPFPTIIDDEIESHSKEHEQHKEHWIEKIQANSQGIFVHYSRHSKDSKHGSWFELLCEKPEKVLVSIVIQPVMDHNIPGPVIVSIRCGVPPILIKHPVTKA